MTDLVVRLADLPFAGCTVKRVAVRLDLLKNVARHRKVAAQILTEEEASKHSSYKVEKRRVDWLGGRLAIKTLLAEQLDLPPLQVRIAPDKNGAPQVHLAEELSDQNPPRVSISHSGDWALGGLLWKPKARSLMGVDIERSQPRSQGVMAAVLTEPELARCDGCAPEDLGRVFARYWTVKEAALKALSVGLEVNTKDIELAIDDEMRGKLELSGAVARLAEKNGVTRSEVISEHMPGYVTTTVVLTC